ncbi:MAG: hypothetical protein ACOVP5_03155 [Chitinophagales bacterium]
MNIKLAVLQIFICSILFSCKMSQRIPPKMEVISFEKRNCDSSRKINHFFSLYAGEVLPMTYRKLAVINSVNGNDPTYDPQEKLKLEALNQCADGIIQLMRFNSRGNFEVKSTMECEVQKETYPVNAYTAFAVEIINRDSIQYLLSDSAIVKKWNKMADARIRKASACQECELKKGPKGLIIGLGGIGGLFFLLILLR